MQCGLRIATANALFAITAAKIGLGYGFASVAALHHKVGPSVTADILFSGRKMTASEAMSKCLCGRVVAEDEFDAFAEAAIAEIADNAPLTIPRDQGRYDCIAGRPSRSSACR